VELGKAYRHFEERGIRILATSADTPDKALEMKERTAAPFEFLSDPQSRLIDLFDVLHPAGRPGSTRDIAQSSSFLVDSEARVLWLQVAQNYRVRPRPQRVLGAADRLLAPKVDA
jgi:peroxiredoxin